MSGLAPSLDLLTFALNNKTMENWFDIYTYRFKKEMKEAFFRANIQIIKELLDNNNDVTLVCYCNNLQCHRFIVAKEFIRLGYEVEIH